MTDASPAPEHRRSAEVGASVERTKRRRRILLTGIPAVLLAALVVAEIAARLGGSRPVTGFVSAGERGWAPQPGQRDIAGAAVTVSPTGTRGPEAAPGGVLLLGDETAFGAGLPDADSLGAVLSRESGAPVTLAACPGYGTQQEFLWLQELAPRLKPRLVIVLYSLDDPRPFAATLFTSLRVFFQRFSALAAPASHPATREELHDLYDPDGVPWRLQKQTLRQIGDWSRSTKIPVIFATWPAMTKQDPALAEYFEDIRGEARINGIFVRNLLGDLGETGLESLTTPAGRPGAEAVRRVAKGLAAEVKEGQ